jgi:hypothetical protein
MVPRKIYLMAAGIAATWSINNTFFLASIYNISHI